MDRKEKPERRSPYANEPQVGADTAGVVPGPAGRESDQGADPGTVSEDDVHQPVGATPRSAVTGRHDPGAGANETVDGLSGTEEMTRQAAEDNAPLARDPEEPREPEEQEDGGLPDERDTRGDVPVADQAWMTRRG